MSSVSLTPQKRLLAVFADLSPELQRAARWVNGHPVEVGLWSMRRQAQTLSLSPATMLRLARAAGYDSYDSFRAPFQQALAAGDYSLRQRAAKLQADDSKAPGLAHNVLSDLQVRAVQSIFVLNTSTQFDTVAQTMLDARLVGFMGGRSSFGTAYQMHYAYQLVQSNGILLDGLGGIQAEQADVLGATDVLVTVAQAPYSATTVRAVQSAHERGVVVVALVDDAMSPLAAHAAHVLLFQPESSMGAGSPTGPGSFFHTMTGPLALAENLVARLAARGGQAVLNRLDDVERRMADEQIYHDTPVRQ